MTSTEPPSTHDSAHHPDGAHDAHDITVNTFLRVTRSPQSASIRNPAAYLIRAITNQAQDHRRQQARRWKRDLAAIAPTATPAPDTSIDIHRQIAKLTVHQRAVVFLTYWEDMTEPAIAEMLGLSAALSIATSAEPASTFERPSNDQPTRPRHHRRPRTDRRPHP